jgi:hypothetical protein
MDIIVKKEVSNLNRTFCSSGEEITEILLLSNVSISIQHVQAQLNRYFPSYSIGGNWLKSLSTVFPLPMGGGVTLNDLT